MTSNSILCPLFQITLFLCLIAQTLSAATFGQFTYKDNDSSIHITGCDKSATGAVAIPATIDGKPVTSIGKEAFLECRGLTTVTIPDSVNSIGDGAFFSCDGLTSITLPNSVTSIGKEMFYFCHGLKSITIPNSVTSIGKHAFLGCNSLTGITIPSSIISIGHEAFFNCDRLIEITVNEGNPAYSCEDGILFDRLKTSILKFPPAKTGSYTIPGSVTSIGDGAFFSCGGLTSVTIPASVTSIGENAFYQCSSLESMTIPNSVTSIGKHAFFYCGGLKSVTIPDSVTSIGEAAFIGCRGLKKVTIPRSVTTIGKNAFYDCDSLVAIAVDARNPIYRSVNGLLFNRKKKSMILCPKAKTGSVTIPGSVISIGEGAFFGCRGLTSVTIPDSITSIGDIAFRDCCGLTRLTLSHNLTSIGFGAFESCTGLTSLTIPHSLTSIGPGAFSSCGGLTDIAFPNSVTSIGNFAFTGCSGLASVTIPASVTSIGDRGFQNCRNLAKAVFLGNAPSVGTDVFSDNASGFTVEFIKGKTGFNSPMWKNAMGVDPAPEIDIQQPSGNSLVDGTDSQSFGTARIGKMGMSMIFIIKNTGTTRLRGLDITKTGRNTANFIVSDPATTTLAPGAFTTFKITFKPRGPGTRIAALHIKSNDADENPFDINLSGLGVAH